MVEACTDGLSCDEGLFGIRADFPRQAAMRTDDHRFGDVHRAERPSVGMRCQGRLMMEGDCFDQAVGQAPEPEEVGAQVLMRRAEDVLFGS